MQIQQTNLNQTAFGMKFIHNANFIDTVKYAEKTGKLLQLDTALNTLKNINKGDIFIVHGKMGQTPFSNFTIGKKSAPVQANSATTAEEVTLNGILDLSKLSESKLFQRLMGTQKIKSKITAQDILEKY